MGGYDKGDGSHQPHTLRLKPHASVLWLDPKDARGVITRRGLILSIKRDKAEMCWCCLGTNHLG